MRTPAARIRRGSPAVAGSPLRDSGPSRLPRNHRAFALLLAAGLAVSSFSARSVAGPRGAPPQWAKIDGVVRQAIDQGRIPGAVVLVGQADRILFEKAYGHRCLEPRLEPMTLETRFDLASLTKVVATTPAVLRLVQEGKIGLDDPVSQHLPDFGRRGKEAITLRQVLTHYSGLAPFFRLEAETPDAASAVIDRICHSGTTAKPGTRFVYSDLGFILLGRLIEVVSGEPLDRFVRSRIFSPLKMAGTRFNPPPGDHHNVAPTEKGDDGTWLRGRVHDPLASTMGGVAGHAGLFSNARDLSRYCRMLLNQGSLEGARVLQPRLVRQMASPQSPPGKPDLRGLGWDIQSRYSSVKGEHFSPRSFGHTGFTGTSLWLDPEIQAYLIILTSRLHPDGRGDVRALRKEIATIVGEALSPAKGPAAGLPQPILVQPQIRFQRVDGFGVSGSNGSASEIEDLPSAQRQELFDLLFSPKEAGLNILRNEIGWTGEPIAITARLRLTGLTHSFGGDKRENAQFSLLRQARKRREVLLSSCIWTPPPPWKSNRAVGGAGSLLAEHYQDLAQYLVGYVEYYQKLRGQPVHLVSLQNRPDSRDAPFGCRYEAGQLRDLGKIVGQKFRQKGIRTRLMVPEAGWTESLPYLQALLDDREARPWLSHVGVQSSAEPSQGADAVDQLIRRHNLNLWQTQFTVPAGNGDEMDEALNLAQTVVSDLLRGCRAWLYGPIFATEAQPGHLGLLERTRTGFRPPKRFRALTQFSRHIPRGAVRVYATGGGTPVAAFRNSADRQLILVLVNPREEAVEEEIELRGFRLEGIEVFRTSADENNRAVDLALDDGSKLRLTLAPKSINTLRASLKQVSPDQGRFLKWFNRSRRLPGLRRPTAGFQHGRPGRPGRSR